MRKKLPLFLLGGGLFLVFVLVSYLVHKNFFQGLDFNTTVRLQDHVSRRFDGIFSFFSSIGSFEPVAIFLLVLLVIHRKLKGIVVLALFGFIHAFELYGKIFVDHLPPPEFMLRTERLINFPQFYVRTQNSYPSGHAARAMFITLILTLIIGKSKKIPGEAKLVIFGLLCIYDITMFISRIYLGEHWLSDVIGGVILGAALGLISIFFV